MSHFLRQEERALRREARHVSLQQIQLQEAGRHVTVSVAFIIKLSAKLRAYRLILQLTVIMLTCSVLSLLHIC